MESIKVSCSAKINLSLNVGKRLDNGYHSIDSIMQTIALFDYITVKKRKDNKINLSFNNASIHTFNNSVTKAISLVKQIIGEFGLDVYIQKNINLCGGLGGSSANASGIIFILDQLFSLTKNGVDIIKLASKVGSDVPFMLVGGLARVTGIGETITPLTNNLDLNIQIVNCGGTQCLSTAVYSIFDKLNQDGNLTNNDLLSALLKDGNPSALKHLSNGLTNSAIYLNNNIAQTISKLKALHPNTPINLTGSGNCVYLCHPKPTNQTISTQSKAIKIL